MPQFAKSRIVSWPNLHCAEVIPVPFNLSASIAPRPERLPDRHPVVPSLLESIAQDAHFWSRHPLSAGR
jgi:hypothetical protein